MKMKKISLIIFTLFVVFLITGCEDKKDVSDSRDDGKIDSIDDIVLETGKLSCTREGSASDGVSPSLKYYVTYKDDLLLKLHSVEKITSDNLDSLDEYENAYKKINEYYKNLRYYDTKVIRDSNSVTRDTIINYEKIDIDKLLSIEGEEDNIIKNGKAKLSLWLEFAKKFGVVCTED